MYSYLFIFCERLLSYFMPILNICGQLCIKLSRAYTQHFFFVYMPQQQRLLANPQFMDGVYIFFLRGRGQFRLAHARILKERSEGGRPTDRLLQCPAK